MAEPNQPEDMLAREPRFLPGGVIAALCAPLVLPVVLVWIYLLLAGKFVEAPPPVASAPEPAPIRNFQPPPFEKPGGDTPRDTRTSDTRPKDVVKPLVRNTLQQILTADAKFLLSVEGFIDRTGKELPNRLRLAYAGGKVFADREFDRGLIRCADLSEDGKFVVVGFVNDKAGEACIWEPAAYSAKAFPGGPTTPVTAVAISADGRWCAAGTNKGVIYVGDLGLAKRHAVLQAHAAAVTALSFSRDGKVLASGGSDKAVHIWQVGSSALVKTLPSHTSPVTCLKFSPNGHWLASGAAQDFPKASELGLWHTGRETGEKLLCRSGAVTMFAFSPDSSLLAIKTQHPHFKTQDPWFGVVTFYNVETENWLASQSIEKRLTEFRQVDCLAFTSDGQKLVWAKNDMTMTHWVKDSIQGKWMGTRVGFPPGGSDWSSWGQSEKEAKAVKAERDKLQGTWALTTGITGGIPTPPEFLGKIKIIFTNDRCEIVTPDKKLDCFYTVTGKSNPGQIKITSEGPKVIRGIYEIRGDTLKLCLIDGDQPRPTEFQSATGSQVTYLVLNGGKAANADKDK